MQINRWPQSCAHHFTNCLRWEVNAEVTNFYVDIICLPFVVEDPLPGAVMTGQWRLYRHCVRADLLSSHQVLS